MKKNFLLILCITFASISVAQKTKKTTKQKVKAKSTITKKPAVDYIPTKDDTLLINKISTEMCDCIGPSFDTLHPLIINYLQNLDTLNIDKAKKLLLNEIRKLNDNEKSKYKNSAEFFKSLMIADNSIFKECGEKLDKKYKYVEEELKAKKNWENKFKDLLYKSIRINCYNLGLYININIRELDILEVHNIPID